MNVYPLQGLSAPSLAEQYRSGDTGTRRLFGAHPGEIADWRRRAEDLDGLADRRADRKALGAALRTYQALLSPHDRALESISLLERDGTLAVVGGQQAGLFGGALLIVYKALTVVQTARHAERLLGRPVVPVFWIAGEDHDFDEANHVYVEGNPIFAGEADGQSMRLRLDRPEGPRHAVSRTSLSASDWDVAVSALARALPDTEFKPALLRQISRHLEDAPTLTLAFARLLSDWFGRDGLILLDSDDPALRRLESPMFREMVDRNEAISAAIAEGEERVKALGYPLQAESSPEIANLFLHLEQGRTLLYRREEGFQDRRGEVSIDRDELLRWTEESPERFSNNALTRPLMQEYLLPVLATVLGPAEIAYWGVLGPSFELFGLRLPLLVPRQSFTYLEPSIAKLLAKYKLTAEELILQGDARKAEWLAAQDRWDLEAKFASVREAFDRLYAPLLETVSAVQPGMDRLGERNRSKILEQIAYLEQQTTGALAKRHEDALRQWDRMMGSLWPQGKPQERVLGGIHFANRYGPGWLDSLREVPFDVTGGHRLLEG
ncbi:bacillithiol biosynthesis cysteine-adding enzyme BshC [Cohnella sp. REN36]|uniref:bacillithiol biosynthesis cysteine-adding enzyme BshC n=1 Tax=Cohnella sp. REN36 TaxID=2887347 RepID=UPI001D15C276|nr:bacillithiol biosynthesis cysteine-adding enzyme BshC [Cohnella sp. REN36]MCC3372845.1 bacillithiol biosynthesis cysteine-adding enzyme BshC [Cohnella sp. REN36]